MLIAIRDPLNVAPWVVSHNAHTTNIAISQRNHLQIKYVLDSDTFRWIIESNENKQSKVKEYQKQNFRFCRLQQINFTKQQGIIWFCLFNLHTMNPFIWFCFTLSSLPAKHYGGILFFFFSHLSMSSFIFCVCAWGCVSLEALEKTLQSRTAVAPRWALLDVYPRGCFCPCPNNAHPQRGRKMQN